MECNAKRILFDRCSFVFVCLLIYIYCGVCVPVSNGSEQLSESILVKNANIVLVKAAKCILDDILGIGALEPLAEHGQEHGEVDGSWSLVHHALEIVIGGILAETGQHVVQVILVDEPVPANIILVAVVAT